MKTDRLATLSAGTGPRAAWRSCTSAHDLRHGRRLALKVRASIPRWASERSLDASCCGVSPPLYDDDDANPVDGRIMALVRHRDDYSRDVVIVLDWLADLRRATGRQSPGT